MILTANPSNVQAQINAAAPLDHIQLTEPGQYPTLRFSKVIQFYGCPGAKIQNIEIHGPSVAPVPENGSIQIHSPEFGHSGPQGGKAVSILDNVFGVNINGARFASDQYDAAVGIESANAQWYGPRQIRLINCRGWGFASLAVIVGECDDFIAQDCFFGGIGGGYGEVYYLNDAVLKRSRLVRCVGMQTAGTVFRGTGTDMQDCIGERGTVIYAMGQACQSMRRCMGFNASRAEIECGAMCPAVIEDSWMMNSLPATALEAGGPGHHNVNLSFGSTRLDWRGGGALTVAPEAGTVLQTGGNRAIGTWVSDAGFYADNGRDVLELGGSATADKFTVQRNAYLGVKDHPGPDPTRTFSRWLAEVLNTDERGYVTRPETIQDAIDWLNQGRGL